MTLKRASRDWLLEGVTWGSEGTSPIEKGFRTEVPGQSSDVWMKSLCYVQCLDRRLWEWGSVGGGPETRWERFVGSEQVVLLCHGHGFEFEYRGSCWRILSRSDTVWFLLFKDHLAAVGQDQKQEHAIWDTYTPRWEMLIVLSGVAWGRWRERSGYGVYYEGTAERTCWCIACGMWRRRKEWWKMRNGLSCLLVALRTNSQMIEASAEWVTWAIPASHSKGTTSGHGAN